MDIDKLILKLYQKAKDPEYRTHIEGEDQNWKIDTTQLQDLLLSCSNQHFMVLVKWLTNRLESSEIDLYKYSQMIFDKGAEVIQWAKVVFSTNGASGGR